MLHVPFLSPAAQDAAVALALAAAARLWVALDRGEKRACPKISCSESCRARKDFKSWLAMPNFSFLPDLAECLFLFVFDNTPTSGNFLFMLFLNIGFDTAENRPRHVCCMMSAHEV